LSVGLKVYSDLLRGEKLKAFQVNETGEKKRKNSSGDQVKSPSQHADEKWPQL
jgi:hypothetical protein